MRIAADDLVFKGKVEMRDACSGEQWVCVFGVFCCQNRGLSRISRMTRIEESVLLPLSAFESVIGLCENQSFDFQTFCPEIE